MFVNFTLMDIAILANITITYTGIRDGTIDQKFFAIIVLVLRIQSNVSLIS